MEALVFAAGLAVFYAAHNVADHVFGQNDHQATNKMQPGISGWVALISHVIAYHLVMLFMFLITWVVLGLPLTWLGLIAAFAFSAVTHGFLDRRWPVRKILELVGSPNFAKMKTPINGMYQADQALHHFCLWISALLLAAL
jgi:hypothetical protein